MPNLESTLENEPHKVMPRILRYKKITDLLDLMIKLKLVILATLVEGDPKAPFSKATTPTGRCYFIPWIGPLYS